MAPSPGGAGSAWLQQDGGNAPYAASVMFIGDNAAFPIAFTILFVVWIGIGLGALVFMIFALVDMVKRPEWQWKLARQEKILWILLVILVNFFAIPTFIYWFNIRKKLQAVEQAAANGAYGPGHMTYAGWEPFLAAPAMAPAGWYPDPSGMGVRWWDGAQWTAHTAAASTPPTA